MSSSLLSLIHMTMSVYVLEYSILRSIATVRRPVAESNNKVNESKKKVSEYYKILPQSYIADQPMAP